MVRINVVAALLFTGALVSFQESFAAGQKTISPPSTVDQVMIYKDRARVTRRVELKDVEKGLCDVVIRDLPIQIQDASVRASTNSPDLRIVSVEVQSYNLERPVEGNVDDLQKQLQSLDDAIKVIDDTLTLSQAEADNLQSVKATYLKSIGLPKVTIRDNNKIEEQREKIDIKDVEETMKFFSAKFAALSESVRAENLKRRDLDKKRQFISGELQKIGSQRAAMTTRKSVKVSVDIVKGGNYTLDILYVNPNVTWSPNYDIRVLKESKEIEIIGYGVVSQNSGEDWLGAEVAFSTTNLSVSGWLPDLQVCKASFPEQAGAYGQKKPSASINSAEQMELNRAVLGQQQIVMEDKMQQRKDMSLTPYVPAVASENIGSYVFKVSTRADILGNGAPNRLAIFREKLPAVFEYNSTPKLSPHAYLIASSTNKMATPIMKGTINVFSGNDFIATSQTDGILPGEEFDLSLGTDENIRISRKLSDKEEKGPGFLSNTKKITYSFLIKIENFKKENAEITVVDQLPISVNKDIAIEKGKFSDEPITHDEKTGKMEWRFTLKPKEIKELTFSFTVALPSDREPAFYTDFNRPVAQFGDIPANSPYDNNNMMKSRMNK